MEAMKDRDRTTTTNGSLVVSELFLFCLDHLQHHRRRLHHREHHHYPLYHHHPAPPTSSPSPPLSISSSHILLVHHARTHTSSPSSSPITPTPHHHLDTSCLHTPRIKIQSLHHPHPHVPSSIQDIYETPPVTQSDNPVSRLYPSPSHSHRPKTHPNRNNHPLTLSNQPLLNRYTISTLCWNFHLHLLP